MKSLTKEQQKSHENSKIYISKSSKFKKKIQKVIFVNKNFKINVRKIKKYCKVRYHFPYTGKYRSATHSICNLKYSAPKKFLIAFHNGSNYDYHFIIKPA